jgi:uncharacterized protein YndB with AHSA1/START domain
MVDILHRVGIKSSPARTYRALATCQGLADWWTHDTTGESRVGGVIAFRFPNGGFDMRVDELVPGQRVVWRVVDGPDDWVGTTIRWELEQKGEFTIVMFKHEGWKQPVEFMHHCTTKWGTFLMSLKALLESGRGAPAPDDVRIDEWN